MSFITEVSSGRFLTLVVVLDCDCLETVLFDIVLLRVDYPMTLDNELILATVIILSYTIILFFAARSSE